MKKIIFAFAMLAVFAAPLTACNTMDGLGQDIKNAGESLSGASKKD